MFTLPPKPKVIPAPDFEIGAGSTIPSMVVSLERQLTTLPRHTQVELFYRLMSGGITKRVAGRVLSHTTPQVAFDWLDGATQAGDYEAYVKLTFSPTETIIFPFGHKENGSPKRYWIRFSANAF